MSTIALVSIWVFNFLVWAWNTRLFMAKEYKVIKIFCYVFAGLSFAIGTMLVFVGPSLAVNIMLYCFMAMLVPYVILIFVAARKVI